MSKPPSPSIGTRITAERPPHRLERLRTGWTREAVDCVVAFGPDNVNYLAGYSRYYGGPSGVVVDRTASGRSSSCATRCRSRRRLGQADSVLGYGERGFGIELTRRPSSPTWSPRSPSLARARRVGIADGLGGMAGAPRRARSRPSSCPPGGELVRLRLLKDEDELVRRSLHAYELCWLGQQAVGEAAARGASEIEMFTAAQSAAQIAHGEPIEFLADLLSGPRHGRGLLPDLASPRSGARRRAIR